MTATTKIDFIQGAYGQMRISGLTVTPSPNDLEVGLDRLEDMAYEFDSRNICTDYNFEETPDPNSLTNVEPFLNQMFKTNLAVRLIPDFNKQVPQTLMAQATQSLSNASGRSAAVRLNAVRNPERMGIGTGNTLRYRPFNRFYRDLKNPPVSCSTNDMFVDDVDDFEENFESYLRDTETVSSFTIEADPGLLLVSSSLTDPVISYRIQALNTQTSGDWQQVKIIATTSLGRKDTRLINFNVEKSTTVGTMSP